MSLNGKHTELESLIEPSVPPIKNSRWRLSKNIPGLITLRRVLGYQERCGRMRFLAVLGTFAFLLLYLTYFKSYQHMIVCIPENGQNLSAPKFVNATNSDSNTLLIPKGFMVWSPNCHMLSLDAFAPDVMKLFKKEKFEPCSKIHPLTSIEQNFDDNTAKFVFHRGIKAKYLNADQNQLECCYQEITRAGSKNTADDDFNLTSCHYFDESFELPSSIEFALVQCKSSSNKELNKKKIKTVYSNAHAIVRRKPQFKKIFDNFRTLYPSERPLSVLMMGIDSVSRLNLIRAMPKTAKHLYNNGWFELKGYNKMDDNTFPNLMAILTGFNSTYSYKACDPTQVGHLDKCPFIWKHFEQSGYVTGFAEDDATISTFNYHKFGFHEQPTTHYFRPFAMAIEKYLKIKYKSSLKFCVGFQNYADFIYNYALDFATAYKNDPFFGLFWTNTFSHNEISDPSSMDERIKYYLEELHNRGILNTSAVIFFSDHGLRFGPPRELLTGWLEERLPFIFIWLPTWFKGKYPNIVQNLKTNRNRLSNPYDLHMTLKHILQLSGRIDNLPPAESCPNCQSIFNELPWNRSCADAGIEQHWCTCNAYMTIDRQDAKVLKVVKFVINTINTNLDKQARMPNSVKPLCAHLYIKSIISARKSEVINVNTTDQYVLYILMFDVSPSSAKFESTVRYYQLGSKKNKFEVTGSISRLNAYSSQSACVNRDDLKKYCFCLKA